MLNIDERRASLAQIAPFATLSDGALTDVAAQFRVEAHPAQTVVFREGDVGDRLLVLISGEAELAAEGSLGEVPLATLGPGDMVGELSLLSGEGKRNATFRALTPLVLMSLPVSKFQALLSDHPQTREAFQDYADRLLVARFIKSVGPFFDLDDVSRRWLAERIIRHSVPAGHAILCEGEIGSSCFMLREGRVEVTVELDGEEQVVALMGPGSMFGEAALLSDSPRTATVRAAEPCEVLELARADLDELLNQHRMTVGRPMVQLFRLQERPRRGAGVLVTERPTPDGDVITILKNPRHMTYYRLSRRGRFIWERLDGFHDMRSLTIEFFREFRQIAPDVIAATVEGLARTRMIDAGRLSDELGKPIVRPSRGDRILMGARRALSAELALRNLDGRVTAAYNRGVRLLFTRPAQFLLAVIAVGGLAAFIAGAASAQRVLGGPHKELIAVILGGASVSLFLHEAAHAFTVKHFGRELHRGGIGWYWFAPVAFVDTSDMWLGTRRERILVSAAGPYADMLVAGLLATAGLLITDPFASTLLWSLALPSYMAVLLNLNPLLEFDGYHVLSDLLDRPNLRSDSLGWLGANFPAVLRDRDARARHRVEFTYSIASLLYIVVSAVVLVVVYRLTVRGLVASVVPADVASALAWVLAAMVTVLAALGSLAELRAGRNARSAGRF